MIPLLEIKEDEQKVEQNIADDEAKMQTANNDDVSERTADLWAQDAVSACVCSDLSDERAEVKRTKECKIGPMRADVERRAVAA